MLRELFIQSPNLGQKSLFLVTMRLEYKIWFLLRLLIILFPSAWEVSSAVYSSGTPAKSLKKLLLISQVRQAYRGVGMGCSVLPLVCSLPSPDSPSPSFYSCLCFFPLCLWGWPVTSPGSHCWQLAGTMPLLLLFKKPTHCSGTCQVT